MKKSYLKYSPYQSFGLISSFPSQIQFDKNGNSCFTGALNEVGFWNLRTGVKIASLKDEDVSANVVSLCVHPVDMTIAVGYEDGWVRIWETKSYKVVSKYKAHKASVTCLCFNGAGSYLASGSNDTDIVIWDVIAEQGIAKLSGHTNAITRLKFLDKTKALVSSSKDTFLKVWDLDTQFCVQTVVGSPSEVWGFDIDESESRLISVCSDLDLRVYKILSLEEINHEVPVTKMEEDDEDRDSLLSDNYRRIAFWGTLQRKGSGRSTNIKFTNDGTLIGVQSSNRQLEILYVHSEEETLKKRKKRYQREKKKWNARVEAGEVEGEYVEKGESPKDEFSHKQIVKTKNKIIDFDFAPGRRGREIVFSYHSNQIELYKRKKKSVEKLSSIHTPGHRNPIRFTTISGNNQMLMTTSTKEVKIWNLSTTNCIRSMPSGYGISGFFVPGDRHVVIGTKEGAIQLFDLNGAECISENSTVHTDSIYSCDINPEKTGFLTASADKKLAIWEFELAVDEETGKKNLSVTPTKTIDMTDSIFCAKYSPDGKYIAVSLADNTVKIYFADTMKFYLSLYGHKLPVTSLDFSDDGAIIATGSADKNIRIWGLDFGDCHRSLFAHDDTINNVQFAKGTHYLFSCGKDGYIKYWDLDRFERISSILAHDGSVWSMALTKDAEFIISVGHDKRIKVWERTKEILIIEAERQTELERDWDAIMDVDKPGDEKEGVMVQTMEAIRSGETLVDALEIAEEEREKWEAYRKRIEELKKNMSKKSFEKLKQSDSTLFQEPEKHPLIEDKSPEDFVLEKIKRIPGSLLESVLLSLSLNQVLTILHYINYWISHNTQTEKICRILFDILKMNQVQLSSHKTSVLILDSLRENTRKNLSKTKDMVGFNLAAMNHLRREIESRDDATLFEVSEKLHQLRIESASGKKTRKNYWEESTSDDE